MTNSLCWLRILYMNCSSISHDLVVACGLYYCLDRLRYLVVILRVYVIHVLCAADINYFSWMEYKLYVRVQKCFYTSRVEQEWILNLFQNALSRKNLALYTCWCGEGGREEGECMHQIGCMFVKCSNQTFEKFCVKSIFSHGDYLLSLYKWNQSTASYVGKSQDESEWSIDLTLPGLHNSSGNIFFTCDHCMKKTETFVLVYVCCLASW